MIKKRNEQGIKEKGKWRKWTTPHFHNGSGCYRRLSLYRNTYKLQTLTLS